MARVRAMVDRTMDGVTDDLFNWAPPGTANTISATFCHLMNVEDNIIQTVLQGKTSIWDRDGWSGKTGIQKPPHIGEDWSAYQQMTIAIDPHQRDGDLIVEPDRLLGSLIGRENIAGSFAGKHS